LFIDVGGSGSARPLVTMSRRDVDLRSLSGPRRTFRC
jgi:hypothetical protein